MIQTILAIACLMALAAAGLLVGQAYWATHDIRSQAALALDECGAGNVLSVDRNSYRCQARPDEETRRAGAH
ncbi:hypothetical protein F1654_02515 [Alkalicaulis satelles]|uniref:Uncharacterized protein n=1 Tax=Alkalicaulis satelles TaxID=2609175 RepID=A0A5M6ZKN8_9PROT|nr:hypothetical protein [Alkalicaulis satelles]KAA5804890.1 hypothetical protein F1654_02515 [Alkalicaulis satelles]